MNKRTGKTQIMEVGAYTREQPEIEVTFTCTVCGKTKTHRTMPGNPPTVCPPPSDCIRKANYERVKRWRAAHKEETTQRQRDYRAKLKQAGVKQ